jgi:hypothetical protein
MSLDGGVLTLSDRGDGYEREEPGEHGNYESTHDLLLQYRGETADRPKAGVCGYG